MWRPDFCTDLPVPTVRRGAAHLWANGIGERAEQKRLIGIAVCNVGGMRA
jgi:hypothetical protein